jgi:hypothetical protein
MLSMCYTIRPDRCLVLPVRGQLIPPLIFLFNPSQERGFEMAKNRNWLPLAAILAALGGTGVGSAQAATCTVADPGNNFNPDASLTDSTLCGPGNLDPNDNSTNIDDVIPGSEDWGLVAKEDFGGGSSGVLGFVVDISSSDGGKTGTWSIELGSNSLATYDLALVMKDGSVDKTLTTWFWFIIDESAVNMDGCGTFDLCGTWSMYGEGGNQKAISHMDLFVTTTTGGPPPQEIPEPGALALMGVGLAGMWASGRRKRQGGK